MQPSSEVRLSLLPNGPSITLVSVLLSWFLHAGRRKGFAQQQTISKQQDQLEQLNANLERRVEEQVEEILEHAREVDRLNAQLQARVRLQSDELAAALAKLARRRAIEESPLAGTLLAGRFEMGPIIGAGGTGVVHAGRDRVTDTPVAIKVIRAVSAAELDSLERFVREARSAASVSHPGIVRMLHVDITADGLLYQVQELVVGETLQTMLRRVERCEPAFVARVGGVLCDALAAAHAMGVIHRDVKPSNVVLTAEVPGLKLLDFGVARLSELERDDSESTLTGVIVGTPAFMGPEQATGRRDITDRVDIYSVGVTLFLALTGRYPWDGTSLRQVMASQVAGELPDVRQLVPVAPDVLAEVIAECLQPIPEARPAARALASKLRGVAEELDAAPLEVMVEHEGLSASNAQGPPTETMMPVADDIT